MKKQTLFFPCAIVVFMLSSWTFILYNQGIHGFLSSCLILSHGTTHVFFTSIEKLVDNFVMQVGFRLLIFLSNLFIFQLFLQGVSWVECKLFSSKNIQRDRQDIQTLAYQLAGINLGFQLFHASLMFVCKKELEAENWLLYTIVLSSVFLIKVFFVYRPFIRNSKLKISSCICILISFIILLIEVKIS